MGACNNDRVSVAENLVYHGADINAKHNVNSFSMFTLVQPPDATICRVKRH
jgi:hypothetical protein